MEVLEYLVIGLAWLFALTLFLCMVLLAVSFRRDPPRWWVRRQVPDTVPDPDKWPKQKAGARGR